MPYQERGLFKNSDFGTYDGCMELVARIRQFWAKRRMYPHVQCVQVYTGGPAHDGPKRTYTVKSDMVGGQPREARA